MNTKQIIETARAKPARVRAEPDFSRLANCAAVLVGLASAAVAAPAEKPGVHLETTADTYVLFLDLAEVQEMKNTELVVGTAEKHMANPIMPLGDLHEWDSLAARPWGGTLLFDQEEKLFKMWYFGMDHTRLRDRSNIRVGYAISQDGVNWEKPNLGLFEHGGNKNNNIVHMTNDVRILKDTAEPDPAKRYQMLSHRAGSIGKKGPTYFPFYSPDGIHWTPGRDVQVSSNKLETHQIMIDPYERDPARRIKLYGKHGKTPATKPGPTGVRAIAMGSGPDIEHILESPDNPILHPNDGLEQELHFASVFPYRGYYLMLYNYNLYTDYYGQGKWGKFVGDIRLAVSRDGEHFQRVNPHQPVVRRGARAEWDSGFLVMANAVDFNGRIHLYYSGANEQWGSFPSDNTDDGPTEQSVAGFTYTSQTGLAVLPSDGFTFLQARDGYGPGVVVTVPIEVKHAASSMLSINVTHALAYRDWVEVEVLDAATGEPIPGYRREECNDVAIAGAAQGIKWGDKNTTLANVGVAAIKLRFYLHGEARLHSFTFNAPR